MPNRCNRKLSSDALRSPLRVAAVALSVGACSAFHRVPKASPTPVQPATSASTGEAPVPIFRGRDGAPMSFVASTSDSKNTRVIMTRDGLTKQAMFRMASEYLAQKYTVDVSDPNAGFLMTPWQATLSRDGVPELRYRTRIVLRFLGDDWKQLALRAEANWLHGDEWEWGYDAALLDSVASHLTSRLGGRHP